MVSSKAPDKELADIVDHLSALAPDKLNALLEFARFLRAQVPGEAGEILAPLSIDRPDQESVISAIRRLSKTYPMLDKKLVFEQTSAAMSAHLLEQVDVVASIDKLEEVFRDAYDAYVESLGKSPGN